MPPGGSIGASQYSLGSLPVLWSSLGSGLFLEVFFLKLRFLKGTGLPGAGPQLRGNQADGGGLDKYGGRAPNYTPYEHLFAHMPRHMSTLECNTSIYVLQISIWRSTQVCGRQSDTKSISQILEAENPSGREPRGSRLRVAPCPQSSALRD